MDGEVVTPTLYEVRYCASTLYVNGIGAAVDAARRLSDAHDRAEIHADGALVAVYTRGASVGVLTSTGRVATVWPSAVGEEVSAVLGAAVERRDRTGVSFSAAAWVEAVLARDAATEG